MIAVALLVVAVVLIGLLLGLLLADWSSGVDVDQWARTNAVDLGPTTAPVVDVYLRNRRGLRRVGALGGLAIPPAFTAATGIDLHVSGLVWLLLGYLVGQVIAELSFARVPASGTRTASLAPRRLVDYVPRPLAIAQVAMPVLCGALGLIVVRFTADLPHPVGFEPGAVDPMAGAILAAPVAIVLATATMIGERRLVRRPQPIVEPDLVVLDDAMRSSSVRIVAATNVAIVAMLITTQLAALANHVETGWLQGSLWVAMSAVLFFAYFSWLWWVNRGWRVSRPGLTVRSQVPA